RRRRPHRVGIPAGRVVRGHHELVRRGHRPHQTRAHARSERGAKAAPAGQGPRVLPGHRGHPLPGHRLVLDPLGLGRVLLLPFGQSTSTTSPRQRIFFRTVEDRLEQLGVVRRRLVCSPHAHAGSSVSIVVCWNAATPRPRLAANKTPWRPYSCRTRSRVRGRSAWRNRWAIWCPPATVTVDHTRPPSTDWISLTEEGSTNGRIHRERQMWPPASHSDSTSDTSALASAPLVGSEHATVKLTHSTLPTRTLRADSSQLRSARSSVDRTAASRRCPHRPATSLSRAGRAGRLASPAASYRAGASTANVEASSVASLRSVLSAAANTPPSSGAAAVVESQANVARSR